MTSRTAACQASLSITNSRSLLKLVSIESVMPSNHPILSVVPFSSHLQSFLASGSFLFFLVLPVYCYQPISLHPHAHMLSHVIPWTSARQTPLSMAFSRQEYWSGLPFPSPIRVFSNESVLHIRWPKYWSFSFSINPSNEYSGLISFRIDWLDLLAVQGTLKSLLQHYSSKALILRHSAFLLSLWSNSHIHTWLLEKP